MGQAFYATVLVQKISISCILRINLGDYDLSNFAYADLNWESSSNNNQTMTAITLSSDLPSELITLEKLTYHNCLALNVLYSNQQIALNNDNKQFPKADIKTGRALDGKLYSVVTLAFEVDESIVISNPTNKKPWMAAMDWGSVSYPVAFKQNSPT